MVFMTCTYICFNLVHVLGLNGKIFSYICPCQHREGHCMLCSVHMSVCLVSGTTDPLKTMDETVRVYVSSIEDL